jgi:hypothetical protein
LNVKRSQLHPILVKKLVDFNNSDGKGFTLAPISK